MDAVFKTVVCFRKILLVQARRHVANQGSRFEMECDSKALTPKYQELVDVHGWTQWKAERAGQRFGNIGNRQSMEPTRLHPVRHNPRHRARSGGFRYHEPGATFATFVALHDVTHSWGSVWKRCAGPNFYVLRLSMNARIQVPVWQRSEEDLLICLH